MTIFHPINRTNAEAAIARLGKPRIEQAGNGRAFFTTTTNRFDDAPDWGLINWTERN